jgi:septum formation protein
VLRFVLASASPARRNLLASAGIAADVVVSGVDESTVDAPDAATLALTLARLKAETVAVRLRADTVAVGLGPAEDALVLGCDSVLEFDGAVHGKPADAAEAARRWYAMRGRSGVLHTGHCLIHLGDGKRAEAVAGTTVHFADVTDEEIAAYVGTGEPLQVAGAFTIDGRGGPFVESIEGDHSNVVGLSLPLLRHLLAELGIGLTDLWQTG